MSLEKYLTLCGTRIIIFFNIKKPPEHSKSFFSLKFSPIFVFNQQKEKNYKKIPVRISEIDDGYKNNPSHIKGLSVESALMN